MSPRLEAPRAVRWITRTLEEAGHETWAVGGAVRDALAGRPSGDWDLTTRATPGEVRRVFRRTVPIRMDHGTVGVLAQDGVMYEVTTFRRDVETTGRHAVVAFARTLDEDLARRDFTINAIAWHPLTGRTHDPFGGAADLDQGILRTVGDPADRFAEDYLRILRALRFAGVFGLEIDGATWRALTAAVEQTARLSAERLREELDKVLASPSSPSRALALYAASGVLAFLYPELDRLVSAPRPGDRGGWYAHSLRTIDHLPPGRPALRWAALLQGLAGGEGGDAAALEAAAMLERLRSSNARIRELAGFASHVSQPPDPAWPEERMRRWLAAVGRERLVPLFRIWSSAARADALRGGPLQVGELREGWRRARAIARSGAPLSLDELAIDGRTLIGKGYRPGRHFGVLLEHLLDCVLEDPSRNREEELLGEAEGWLAEREIHPA